MSLTRLFRQIVSVMACLAILLLAPTALAGKTAMSEGSAAAAADTHANAGSLDCCDDHAPVVPSGGDCRPGMACHASPPAVTPPSHVLGEPIPGRMVYRLEPDDLVVSRPGEGILRPPRALVA